MKTIKIPPATSIEAFALAPFDETQIANIAAWQTDVATQKIGCMNNPHKIRNTERGSTVLEPRRDGIFCSLCGSHHAAVPLEIANGTALQKAKAKRIKKK